MGELAPTQMTSIGSNQLESLPDYNNEKIFQRNRLPARAYDLPKDSLLLSGKWNFHYAPTPMHAPPVSGKPDIDGSWTDINVPGHWQLQGFGHPHYTNTVYPFPVRPPHIPTENPTGTYHRTFTMPETWAEHSQLRLRFDGVDSAFHLLVNGQEVGYHQGSRNTSEFDVSGLVKRGFENDLVVRVYQWCDGSYIEDQDQWWLSGIFRDVYLIALPQSRMEDFAIVTKLDSEYRDATLEVALLLQNVEGLKVSFGLRDHHGNGVELQDPILRPETKGRVTKSLAVSDPKKWTAETPNLYSLTIQLRTQQGETLQSIETRIGFRSIEIRDGILTVNGKRILLQGVNRHDHHPEHGRAVPLEYIKKDLLLMKANNINALRCSHYPPDPRMLDLCDELGFWVMDEADLECHGFYDCVAKPQDIPESMNYEERKKLTFPEAAKYTSDNPSWQGQYVDRMEAMVQRDKNHPSVIIWSLGNEAFYGQNHKAMYDYAKAVDPTRPVHYEGDAHAVSADMYSYMYPSVERLKRLADTEGVTDGKFEKPIVLCEYGHAMGNGPGNLEGYQQAFRDVPRLQGGFIWEWANHGLWKKDDKSRGFYAYGGDFGDEPNDDTFVMDGLCHSDHTPTPGLVELKKVAEPVHAWVEESNLVVQNRYGFRSLDHLTAVYKVKVFTDRYAQDLMSGRSHANATNSSKILASGTIDLPQIEAGQTSYISLPAEVSNANADSEIWLTVSFRMREASAWAKAGHEIAWSQHQLQASDYGEPRSSHDQRLNIEESATVWTITSGDSRVTIDRTTGMLQSWQSKGVELLAAKGPRKGALHPSFWRAPTDNDRPSDDPYWKRFGVDAMTSQLRSLSIVRSSDDEVEIVSKLYLAPPILDWGMEASITYTIKSDESISIGAKLTPRGKAPANLPRIGLDLYLSKALTQSGYFGLGPGESYPDKRGAQKVDIHSSPVRDLHTSYDVPQENGNRMDARWVKLNGDGGPGLHATRLDQDKLFSWAASMYSAESLDATRHPCDLREENMLLLRLDGATGGVGSGACGPGVLERDQVKCEESSFAFRLRRV
ncbi:Beta-galactosidase (Lactase) [Saxophila tyrrhenica]|uniref:Lactase n=1 Tax=Saxophila tyrrhenica TaxID=1690608 RepID=A0AAV9P3N1_9PEZI|nr:Beta-galactosidase (Lactase) [Saxophila tyrrhenica]